MPREIQSASPVDESVLAKVRKAIADKLAFAGAATLTSGMATVVAHSLLAIALPSSFTDAALTQFLSSLSANWLSQIVWDLRRRMEKRALNPAEEQETLRRLSEDVVPQLSDRDLGEVLARLSVIETTLRAAETAQVNPGPLIGEMLRVGLATKDDINAAVARIRPSQSAQTQINTAINSTVITFVGDQNTIITGETEAQRREYTLLEEVKMHRAQLVRRHAPLDLRGLDIVAQASAAGGSLQFRLENVYTPLLTSRSTSTPAAESASILTRGLGWEPLESIDPGSFPPPPPPPPPSSPASPPAPPSRFRRLFERLLGWRNQSNETPAESAAHASSVREVKFQGMPPPVPVSISILAALNDAPRAVILGKGGSGKSTELKHLVLGLCGGAEEFEREWRHGPLLPIWVTLREFVDDAHARGIGPCETAEQREARDKFNLWLKDDPAEALIEFVVSDLKWTDGRRRLALPHLAQNLETWLSERGGVFLLDGLDEVPSAQRLMVRRAIAGLAERYPRCRCIVACRPYSYRDEQNAVTDRTLKIAPGGKPFAELDVLPLAMPQIDFFVRHWYAQLADMMPGLSPGAAAGRAGELVTQIEQDERLRVLAETPLLLTLIGSLHGLGNRRLPSERWELLKQAVDLLLVSWQRRKREISAIPSVFDAAEVRIHEALDLKRSEALLARLYQLAYDVHAGATTLDPSAASDITEPQLMAALRDVLPVTVDASDLELAQYLRDRAGLILDEGGRDGKEHVYRFPHRMFQEYLCACHVRESFFEVAPMIDNDFERWQEVYALLALMSESATFTMTCVDALCPHPPASVADWRRIDLAVGVWADFPPHKLESLLKNARHPVAQHIGKIREWLQARMNDIQGTRAPERSRAGDALGRLGDLRFDPEHWFLPRDESLGFVRIEADPDFRIGTRERNFERLRAVVGRDDFAYRYEINDALTPTRPFYIARYPVTVAQFCASPVHRHDVIWREPNNRPVGNVSWRDAITYCKWLETQLKSSAAPEHLRAMLVSGRWRVTLPSELEWEKAARGGLEAKIFSWGDDVNPDMANCRFGDDVYSAASMLPGDFFGSKSAVGSFPANTYGLHDMLGNVWELTRTEWKPYPYDPATDFEAMEPEIGSKMIVQRGGSHMNPLTMARCACRFPWSEHGTMIGTTGFRVVLSPSAIW